MRISRQTGFSLVELVIVIVILGLLAATAIPRFLNVTDDAENASVEGVAGGLATAVSFVRSQWEVDGRNNTGATLLDGNTVFVDPNFGYPTGTAANAVTDVSADECQDTFDAILQNPPRNVLGTQDARNARYTVTVIDGAGGSVSNLDGTAVANVDLCVYHQVATLTLDATTGVPTATLNLNTAGANGITYNPASGAVVSFSNP